MMSTFGIFGLSGQACAAGSRLLVHRSLHDELVDRLSGFAKGMAMGDPLNPATMLGPVIAPAHNARIRGFVADGTEAGATIAFAGDLKDLDPDRFVPPQILTGVTPQMALWKQEVFGPVLSVTAFDDDDEAIALANDTVYGLAAGLWTQDVGRAHRVASRIDAGVVWVNTYGTLPVQVPFGGFKQSGWGKEGGRDALVDYTRVKSVIVEA
jgi:acyl-CoA reductase-like NAD-dependent aldehyde dehydrogenase